MVKIKVGETEAEITIQEFIEFFLLTKKLASGLRIPKLQKGGQVKVYLAIKTENFTERKKLENDLVNPIKKILISQGYEDIFIVECLDQEISSTILGNSDAHNFLLKNDGQLLIYGDLKIRKHNGHSYYSFLLNAFVIHKPIPILVSKEISREFSDIFPTNVRISTDNELDGFADVQDWMEKSIIYMVGVAAGISGHLNLANYIFKNLRDNFRNTSIKFEQVRVLKRNSVKHLVEINNKMHALLYEQYVSTRNIEYLISAKEHLDLIQQYSPLDPRLLVALAIYYFVVEKDIHKAYRTLLQGKHSQDSVLCINMAFINAYSGKLIEAKKQYDKIDGNIFDTNVIGDAEIFIDEILQKDPTQFNLYFARGYINYKLKEDYALAQKDFQTFLGQGSLELSQSDAFRLAKIYMKELAAKTTNK